jgi:glycosyltransferase involved in cell wall biosynthesis
VSEPLPVTLCISTRNEAAGIRDCITSCTSWVSEVIVVDMESEDNTVAIARELGAHVISVPRAGFAEPGRQQGIDAASQPWLLVIDVDERPGPRLHELVRATVERDEVVGLSLPRQNFLFGRWIRHSGCWPDYQMRLFRREATQWPPFVHMQARVEGPTSKAPASPDYAIVHRSCPTVHDYVSLTNTYTDFEVDRYLAFGRRASLLRLLLIPPARFFHTYVAQRGFRDGRYGLAISLLMAFYAVMLELKLWERQWADQRL